MRSGLPSISPREVSISMGGLIESVQRLTTSCSSASSWRRVIPCTSPASVTPQSMAPPLAFAKAASSSVMLCPSGRAGRSPLNSNSSNSQ